MALLGLGSGLPFLLVSVTLAYWLKDRAIPREQLTMIASAGTLYSLKFLWSPLVDRLRLPLLGRFGQRRSWLLLAQAMLIGGLLAMAAVTPDALALFIGLTLFVAFAGATLDIVVDAYRIEIAPLSDQGALMATYSFGYRIGLIVSGALALALADHLSWSTVYRAMAAAMLVPVATVFFAREPAERRVRTSGLAAGLREGVVEPFTDFFARFGVRIGLVLLVFVLLFKISDQALGGGIMADFYLGAGFTKSQIAAVAKVYGVWIGMAGAFAGGVAVVRLGVERALLVGIVIASTSNLLYLVLVGSQGEVARLVAVLSGENFAEGFLGTAGVAYLSGLVNQRHTATQYALLSSLVTMSAKVLGFFSGAIVDRIGYTQYFVMTALAAVPALGLWFWLRRRVTLADGNATDTEASARPAI